MVLVLGNFFKPFHTSPVLGKLGERLIFGWYKTGTSLVLTQVKGLVLPQVIPTTPLVRVLATHLDTPVLIVDTRLQAYISVTNPKP
jgi:hypothetical protein